MVDVSGSEQEPVTFNPVWLDDVERVPAHVNQFSLHVDVSTKQCVLTLGAAVPPLTPSTGGQVDVPVRTVTCVVMAREVVDALSEALQQTYRGLNS